MPECQTLLVELGTEELPPKALSELSADFSTALRNGLASAQIKHGTHRDYASPRRLAILIEQVCTAQPDLTRERRGPAITAAFDSDGEPTRAALGFARSCGVELPALERLQTDKGEWLVHREVRVGKSTRALLPDILTSAVDTMPIPKRMRWGTGTQEFVRPLHWLLIMLGGETVPATLFGIESSCTTRGHRFHHPGPLRLSAGEDYPQRLREEGYVIAEFGERRRRIEAQVQQAAEALGAMPSINPALLDEVTGLVEWPVPITASFDERFLAMPEEALIATLQDHQKYFPLRSPAGRLLPSFVTIANIESRNPELVRQGNERVVRPRLADAEFFWRLDRKCTLEARRERLAAVTFQRRLGSLSDKTDRLTAIALYIGKAQGLSADIVRRAAQLCKCDLLTHMVGEFPELQGIMGRHYALNDGENVDLAESLDQYYQPRYANDGIPALPLAQTLAIADRLDSLVGIFAVGEHPTGNRDPYGLRRAALGLVRILIEGGLDLDLRTLLAQTAAQFPETLDTAAVLPTLETFVLDRLQSYYSEAGFQIDEFEAVRSTRPSRPLDFDRRLRALARFRQMPQAVSLVAANKRIRNLLRKTEDQLPTEVDPQLLHEDSERQLSSAVQQASRLTRPLMAGGNYEGALVGLADLHAHIDRFFDEVLVMAEDPSLRHNRLALLSQLQSLFLGIADLSRLQTRATPIPPGAPSES